MVVSGMGATYLTAQFVAGTTMGIFGSILVVSVARRFVLGRIALGESPQRRTSAADPTPA
ncbi:hypothetical protein [Microbacterium sp. HMWF026]|uniref:hypothetical protein n=1 Tax=Microbacterium sp. HMWF026 TaxID=2056861 RepID=UPI0011B1D030|nr:hypothetical protein [Microbacterium sp. HMWF026]